MNKRVLLFLASGHFVNDFLNGIVGAILPLLIKNFSLSYVQAGALLMAANISSSLIQPVFGYFSDRKGSPWILPFGALSLGVGLLAIPYAPTFLWIIPAVCLSSIGSAAFHPDASRAVHFAAGDKRGLAQSIFQIGGNSGMALSPLALGLLGTIGLKGTAWFMIPAVLSCILLSSLVRWFGEKLNTYQQHRKTSAPVAGETRKLGLTLLVSVVTVRSWIISGITFFVPLVIIHRYGLAPKDVWIYSFIFLLFGAFGTMAGGPLADRLGQRAVIRLSMIVASPLAVALPYVPRAFIIPDLALLGFFLLSTFAVTVVYGQELLPGNVAMVSGLLIGFAGGIGGLGTMGMGYVADRSTLELALRIVVWVMPVAALCTLKLPADRLFQIRLAQSSVMPEPVTAK